MAIVFHGTSSRRVPQILQEGIKGSTRSFEDKVFVATNPGLPADAAQITAEGEGSEPVILVIDTKKRLFKDPEFPDEDFPGFESRFVRGRIPPSEIVRVVVGKPSGFGDFTFEGLEGLE